MQCNLEKVLLVISNCIIILLVGGGCNSNHTTLPEIKNGITTPTDRSALDSQTAMPIAILTPIPSSTPTQPLTPTTIATITSTPTSTSKKDDTYYCGEIVDISLTNEQMGWAVVNCGATVSNRELTKGVVYRLADGYWQLVPDAPNLNGPYACYTAISAVNPDDVWAVGLSEGLYTCERGNRLFHYSNGKWKDINLDSVFSSLLGWHYTGLYDIYMVDSENGWIGGNGYILRYNKGEWSPELELEFPTKSGQYAMMFIAIGMADLNNGWASGWNYYDGGALFHYRDNGWNLWEDTTFDSTMIVKDIQAINADEAWAVGYRRVPDIGIPLIWHYSNGHWLEIKPPILEGQLHSVKMIGDEGWAVGTRYTAPFVLHYTNGQWEIASTPTNVHPYSMKVAIDATSSDNVWLGAENFYRYISPNDWQLVEHLPKHN